MFAYTNIFGVIPCSFLFLALQTRTNVWFMDRCTLNTFHKHHAPSKRWSFYFRRALLKFKPPQSSLKATKRVTLGEKIVSSLLPCLLNSSTCSSRFFGTQPVPKLCSSVRKWVLPIIIPYQNYYIHLIPIWAITSVLSRIISSSSPKHVQLFQNVSSFFLYSEVKKKASKATSTIIQ